MATNIKVPGHSVTLRLAVSAGVVANDVVTFSDLSGIAITDRDADGYAMVQLPIAYVATLSVLAENNTVGSAVAVGDKLYNDTAETPDEINKDSTAGKPIGYALEAITSGATATIEVGIAAL